MQKCSLVELSYAINISIEVAKFCFRSGLDTWWWHGQNGEWEHDRSYKDFARDMDGIDCKMILIFFFLFVCLFVFFLLLFIKVQKVGHNILINIRNSSKTPVKFEHFSQVDLILTNLWAFEVFLVSYPNIKPSIDWVYRSSLETPVSRVLCKLFHLYSTPLRRNYTQTENEHILYMCHLKINKTFLKNNDYLKANYLRISKKNGINILVNQQFLSYWPKHAKYCAEQ